MEITNETQIITICPACSSQELHDVLKRRGSDQLVRCTECGSVHNVASQARAAPETTSVRIIVSAGEDSAQYTIELPPDHEVYTGDELLVDDPSADEVHLAEVASVESHGARVISAVAANIDTIWSRAIDKVTVKVAIHNGKKTRSVKLQEYGDREFTVGSIEDVSGSRCRIIRIKTRERGFRKYAGNVVSAKDIKRIFAE
ncbi:MAG: HVO_0476 family zinc finger protein, partial [Euryarchaeota archaeon]|nr:HVO_0476 family zinc finger protein [Euryarchaeota archaeon]